MKSPPLFKNRVDAGQKLGKRLKKLKLQKPVVIAIPNGGVVVGDQVAKLLKSPLDCLVVEKIYYPHEASLGFGAVGPKVGFYSAPLTDGLPEEILKTQTEQAVKKRKVREKKFLKVKKRINLRGKTVIVVDDSLATGLSIMTATQWVLSQKPAKIIIAAPVVSGEAITLLKDSAGKLISLHQHPKSSLISVSNSYRDYPKVTDKTVIKILKEHA